MVFYSVPESDRPTLSLILPHLYLGAETDVTQDCLISEGISYVLSVSRCCPQPAFLPQSQYFRIPIDDSLRDELLPWIPEALRFIDGAMSLGCSVLVHCAAGISRSPALTVAYVMYHLGLDLDEAYRFVKERRPSISPNFNFLGQLQCFQGTLTQKNRANQNPQLIKAPDSCLQGTNEDIGSSSLLPVLTNQDAGIPVAMDNNFISKGCPKEIKMHKACENPGRGTDSINQGYTCLDNADRHEQEPSALTLDLGQEKQFSAELSLSDKIRTLTLDQREMHRFAGAEIHTQNPVEKSQSQPMPKPREAQSLTEKRKTLTLSLAPLNAQSQTYSQRVSENHCNSNPQGVTDSSKTVQKRETQTPHGTKGQNKKTQSNVFSLPSGKPQKGLSLPCGERSQGSTCKSQKRKERDSYHSVCLWSCDNSSLRLDQANLYKSNSKKEPQQQCNTTNHHQAALDRHCASAVEAVEALDVKQFPLSPLNPSVSRFFDWGGRMLLGALLGSRIKLGQAALPYRC